MQKIITRNLNIKSLILLIFTAVLSLSAMAQVACPTASTPYNGVRATIPGKVEAENFDAGGQNVAYYDGTPSNIGGAYRTAEAVDIENCLDAGGGYNVGWMQEGEWVKYSVNVTTTGNYTFRARVATDKAYNQFISFRVDCGSEIARLAIPNPSWHPEGWQFWEYTESKTVFLTAGNHVFEFTAISYEYNVNFYDFQLQGAQSVSANAGPDQTLLTNQTATLTGSGSGGTAPYTYLWEQVGTTPAATIDNPLSASTTISGLTTAGTRTFKLTITDNTNATATDLVDVIVNAPGTSSSYGNNGNPWPIPGTLQAENYDVGGQGVAYNDLSAANYGGALRTTEAVDVQTCSEGGYNVGWIQGSEWLKFSVNVAAAGNYTFSIRVASVSSGSSVQLLVDNVNTGAAVPVPNTGGWQTWTTVSNTVSLPAGNHTFQFLFNGNGVNQDVYNINWFKFDSQGYQPPTANAGPNQTVLTNQTATLTGSGTGAGITYLWDQTGGTTATIDNPTSATTTISGLATTGVRTFRLTVKDNVNATATSTVTVTVNSPGTSSSYGNGGQPWPIPGTLQAENYDIGGQNVAYNDVTPGNTGNAYRTTDAVDIQSCSEGGYNVGWIQGGEWLKFSVNVTTTGSYTFSTRVASVNNSTSLQLEVDGVPQGSAVPVPNTAGWQTWQTVSTTVSLAAGNHTFRFIFIGNGVNQDIYNINWFSFTLLSSTRPVVTNLPVTAEEDNGTGLQVKVFSNPSTTDFRLAVTSNSNEPVTVRILDINGKVKNVLPVIGNGNIRIGADLQTGIYMAEVKQGNKRKVVKLVKVN